MAASGSPPLPDSFRSLRGYVKLASDHEQRDPIVAYYTRMYIMQRAMAIDSKSQDCRMYLMSLMDMLEQSKQNHAELEAIQSEIVGQAHVEAAAIKLFGFGDSEDRAAHFSVKLVKVFHSCSLMIDVLKNFGDGELSEDLVKCQKYAKWKAAYIHQCLQTGQTPIPGPLTDEGDEDQTPQMPNFSSYSQPAASQQPGPSYHQPAPSTSQLPSPPTTYAPPTTPSEPAAAAAPIAWQPPANPAGVKLTPNQYQLAMKWCKYAGSALQYQDSQTAIDNLNKALTLLTTGHES